MAFINLGIDQEEIGNLTRRLDGCREKIPEALKNAVNDTARDAKKDLANKAAETYAVKKANFKRAIKQENATKSSPLATLVITGKANALTDFRYSTNRGEKSAKGKLLKARSLKDLTEKRRRLKAFVVKFKSGHVAVVRREPSESYTRGLEERQRKKLDTAKLREYLAPPIPRMIGNKDKVYGVVEPKMQENLRRNMEKQVEKILRER